MAVFVVTWNLNNEGGNYAAARAKFIKQLDAYDYKMTGKLDTVAWLSSDMDAEDISKHLNKAQDKGDTLFVSELNDDEYNGRLTDEIWDWIEERL
ncbi:hypothetical protein [Sphingomonas sp. PP-CE-1G-424]|uniref:hypothetical protein n=1 Tax=Sphingomonas sp. PP-CE-1G-424 TaxID=2135658 RepID=UPI0010552D27|nr:hypothetical protein [Sphingomonas sp. PP-CE-1G-424]TCP66290.1 hypothetical protein C8J43_10510 [Sphingomonas sp. PP-CE-1G-424]